MSRLARCPLCGKKPRVDKIDPAVVYCFCFGLISNHRAWNRLCRLVRKGRMFESLERRSLPRPKIAVKIALAEYLDDVRAATHKRKAPA